MVRPKALVVIEPDGLVKIHADWCVEVRILHRLDVSERQAIRAELYDSLTLPLRWRHMLEDRHFRLHGNPDRCRTLEEECDARTVKMLMETLNRMTRERKR